MKAIKKIIRFIGGVNFAIILISFTVFFVIAGTFLESKTGSHLHAAHWSYNSPAFNALLFLFFLNILTASLRRWPFQKKHIPFLTTHLGLLLLLAGCIGKNLFGLQGHMLITEGAGSNLAIIPDTQALHIEQHATRQKAQIPLAHLLKRDTFPFHPDSLNLRLINHIPHSEEKVVSWFKDDFLRLYGMRPIKIGQSTRWDSWQVAALETKNARDAAEEIWMEGTHLKVVSNRTGKIISEGSLAKALKEPIAAPSGTIKLSFDRRTQELKADYRMYENGLHEKGTVAIALAGEERLVSKNARKDAFGQPAISLILQREPSLLFLKEQSKAVCCAFGPNGETDIKEFEGMPDSFYIYNDGFAGYSLAWKIPFSTKELNAGQAETEFLKHLEKNSQPGIDASRIPFLHYCWTQGGWCLPSNAILPGNIAAFLSSVQVSSIPENELKAAFWISQIYEKLDTGLREGEDIRQLLHKINWPLAINGGLTDAKAIMNSISKQIYHSAELLPAIPDNLNEQQKAVLLSALFRLYSLHLDYIPRPKQESHETQLETPLSLEHLPKPALSKWEDNVPAINLEVERNGTKEKISLAYQVHGAGLKWPALGKYLLAFRPLQKEIPYRIRLRHARTIHYPGTAQPYSYESDIIITDSKTGTSQEKTISMNNVHETWDGYRFYLAGIAPSEEGSVKTITLVVNHDPAKYYLTYPGAIFLSLGIILLFWGWRKRSSL